ncbi:hypothetical protein VW35_02210 [Devosia soli]|uniref:Uncharacterized protein n=1 Tax=Devosia soli TaxID=361041 RepID=A0A0F5LF39_9HYPH|nr:hypothetical protein [Devosia soli]KKB81006.1 hypothetical protein VW35_02210 [Devosia soli]
MHYQKRQGVLLVSHLISAKAKLRRADTHIADLDRALGAFLETRPFTTRSDIIANVGQVWRFVPTAIPLEIESIVADAVHNLRTPLDKMLTAYADHIADVSRKGHRHKGIGFPTGANVNAFERSLADQKKHFPAAVIDFLKDAEPYRGGKGALIFAMHDLDIGEKHHPLLMPIILGSRKKQLGTMKTSQGFPLRWGSRSGSHMVPASHARPGQWDMVVPDGVLKPVYRTGPSGERFLEFSTPYDDMEFLTTTPGTVVDMDFQPNLSVGFYDIPDFEGQPIVDVLKLARSMVEEILASFECRFLI